MLKEIFEEIIINNPGAFTKWCKEQGFEEVNCDCICKGIQSDDVKTKKRAIFAYEFGFKKNGKICDCAEKLLNK